MTVQQLLEAAASHYRAGRFGEAESIARQALSEYPNHAGALHLMGLAAAGQGRTDEAISLLGLAVAEAPDNPSYHSNLGNVLAGIKRIDEAIGCYQHAIQLKPDFAGAHNNLGSAFKDVGRPDEAVAEYRRAIALNPDFAEAVSNLGDVLTDKGQLPEAIECLHRAIQLNPNFSRAHCNLGVALQRAGEIDKAMASYRRAIQLDRNFAKAHNNFGIALRETGQLEEAVAACSKAIALAPDFVDAHWSLALALLTAGDLQRGVAEYEWRWRRSDLPWTRHTFSQPRWDGEPLEERTLLIHAEQGLGDTIQFARYLPMVAQRGGKIIFECQPNVSSVIRQIAAGIEVFDWGQDLPAFDVHCPLMSLPLVFKTELQTIPAAIPYLKADENLSQKWAAHLAGSIGFKVGIAWAGSARHKLDAQRSLSSVTLSPLTQIPGVTLFSLQKDQPATEIKLIDFTAELSDFTETAALIDNLDLVISVDSAVAHLAGAMGKPTWVMLPLIPDWRWMLKREDSPWYPTMRLFRQERTGEWTSVIHRIAAALRTR
jgi:tetratricopeptide (TPR) repeat protein